MFGAMIARLKVSLNCNQELNMKYKVWVEIEAVDDDLGIYEDASAFPVCLGEFDTLEEADQAIMDLTGESSL